MTTTEGIPMAMAKTQSSIVTQAKQVGSQIKTEEQAKAALKLANATLKKAVAYTKGFRFVDRAAGTVRAEESRINQQLGRLAVLYKKPFSRTKADSVGLAVLQSAELLADLKKAAAQTAAESTLSSYIDQFADGMRTVLEKAAKKTVEIATGAMPSIGWIALAGYVLMQRKRR